MKRKGLISAFIAVLMLVSVLSVLPLGAASTTTLRFYFTDVMAYDFLNATTDPLGTYRDLHATFTLEWIVEDVTDCVTWGCAISWDPAILECTSAAYGPSFKAVDPACMQMPFTVDNTAGTIETPGESLTTGTVSATVYPDAAILFIADFRVIDYGTTWLNWTTVHLGDASLNAIPCTWIDGWFNNTGVIPVRSPTANFTYVSPPGGAIPGVWTFDASASTGGCDGANPCPINRYWWDWENDGVIDNVLVGEPSVGDIDGDGKVFTKDLGLFAWAWASEVGDPNYDPRCDFDGDGKVFTVDLGLFARDWCTGMEPPTITHNFVGSGSYMVNLTVYAPPSLNAHPEYHPYDSMVKQVTVYWVG